MTEREAAVQKLMDSESDLKVNIRKQTILDKLCETLQITDGAWDVENMMYRNFGPDNQMVDIEWQAGHHKIVNVTADSDTAMIRDVMNHLGC